MTRIIIEDEDFETTLHYAEDKDEGAFDIINHLLSAGTEDPEKEEGIFENIKTFVEEQWNIILPTEEDGKPIDDFYRFLNEVRPLVEE